MEKINWSLRPWSIDDLDSVCRHAESGIADYMSDAFPKTRNEWNTFLEKVVNNPLNYYRAIQVNSEAVGGIGVHFLTDIKRNNAELGYWISKKYQGYGIITGAIKQITTEVFGKYSITRIFASPFENNPASVKVLVKAGFKIEAKFEKTIEKNGILLDELVYSIRK